MSPKGGAAAGARGFERRGYKLRDGHAEKTGTASSRRCLRISIGRLPYVKHIPDFLIEGLAYVSNTVGIGMIVVGSAIVISSERITRVTSALHRRTLGIELPRAKSTIN